MSRTHRAALQFLLMIIAVAAPAAYAADIKVHIDDTTVARGENIAGAAAFIVRLDQPVPKGSVITIDWETVDGTATAKVNYVAGKGSIKINPNDGKMNVLVVVPLITGRAAARKCAFSVKFKASITGAHTVTVDNQAGKAKATIFKDTTRVAPRAS